MKGISKLKAIVWLFMLMAGSLSPVFSQSSEGHSLLYFISRDSASHEIMGYFYKTQSPLFQDPTAPRFIIASRDNNIVMGIGGYVMFRGWGDFDGICSSDDFLTSKIPTGTGTQKMKLGMTAAPSRIFLKLIANTGQLGPLTAHIEGDFLGASRTFRLRHANIQFMGFTIGQATSTFIDLGATAPSLDQNGNIVASAQRSPLIRYEYKNKHFRVGIGAEMPSYTGTYSLQTAKASAEFPDIPLYLQGQWGASSHIRLSGILRNLAYKNTLHSTYHQAFGVGGKLSGAIQLADPLRFYFYTLYGKGVASYTLDLSGVGADLLPDYRELGKMFTPHSAIYYGGFKIDYSKALFSDFTYSYIRLYPGKTYLANSDISSLTFYRYAQSVTANIIWKFSPNAWCGLEYCWGERTNFDKSRNHANRIYTAIRYNF